MKYFAALLLFLCCHCLRAQERHLTLANGNQQVSINDSRKNTDGSMIHAGYTVLAGTNPIRLPLVCKTDATGKVLWSYSATFLGGYEFTRVRQAANGDYLLLASGGFFNLLRINANGTLQWQKRYSLTNSMNHQATGLTELPNGNIAVCGTNEFDFNPSGGGLPQWQGYLFIADAAGNPGTFYAYGHTQSAVTDAYMFNDVLCHGNKLYIVGAMGDMTLPTVSRGMLLTADLNGIALSTHVMQAPVANGQILGRSAFTDFTIAKGKVYLNGWGSSQVTGKTHQIAGRLDSLTLVLKGYATAPAPFTIYGKPALVVNDSNEYYMMAVPEASSGIPSRAFVSRVFNGSLSYTRKIAQPAFFAANSLQVAGDTVVVTGGRGTAREGYLGYYRLSTPSAYSCGISDTSVGFAAITDTLQEPLNAPLVYTQAISAVTDIPYASECVYALYQCGDVICPPSFAAGLDTLSMTRLCLGDTAKLFSGGCYPKKWLFNNTLLSNTGNSLYSTNAGVYKVVISDNACTDTSDAITIQYRPLPVIHQSGDTLISTGGLSYQWLDSNGNNVLFSTARIFFPSHAGRYYVRVTDSFGCTGVSAPFVFVKPSGIAGIQNAGELSLYPNPAGTVFFIHHKGHQPLELSLSDLSGKRLHRLHVKPGISEFNSSDLGLQAGIYLLSGAGTASVQKLVIGLP